MHITKYKLRTPSIQISVNDDNAQKSTTSARNYYCERLLNFNGISALCPPSQYKGGKERANITIQVFCCGWPTFGAMEMITHRIHIYCMVHEKNK